MRKSLKVLCFVLPIIVALLIIAAILIYLYGDPALKSTIESAGIKTLNVSTRFFKKIVDFILFCAGPVWNVYIKIFYEIGPLIATGVWYEVVVKVAGVIGLLILVTEIYRLAVIHASDDITNSVPCILYLVGFIWLVFCAIVIASLVGAIIVFSASNL
jgi:hypothetical protein